VADLGHLRTARAGRYFRESCVGRAICGPDLRCGAVEPFWSLTCLSASSLPATNLFVLLLKPAVRSLKTTAQERVRSSAGAAACTENRLKGGSGVPSQGSPWRAGLSAAQGAPTGAVNPAQRARTVCGFASTGVWCQVSSQEPRAASHPCHDHAVAMLCTAWRLTRQKELQLSSQQRAS
jgi:hypothetical protein